MAPVSEDSEARTASLVGRGLDEKAAATAAQTTKTYDVVDAALEVACVSGVSDADARRRAAMLVYTATTKFGDKKLVSRGVRIADAGREMVYVAIGDGRITGNVNLEAAVAWLVGKYETGATANDAVTSEVALDVTEFEAAAGVGVVVDEEDVRAAVQKGMEACEAEIRERRYRFNAAPVQKSVMEKFRFVEGKTVRSAIMSTLEEILGPKTEADLAKPVKVKTKKAKPAKPVKDAAANGAPSGGGLAAEPGLEVKEDPFEGIPSSFHARDLQSARNTPELLEKRIKATGGKIMCRFPPEPNGFLHVGHAKAMFIDFGFAKKSGGETILRFDDTNPTAESTTYVDSIKEMVEWMGYAPVRVTYSSDYFDELHELAIELIRRGKAYVCHQKGDDIKKGRENMTDSPYRERSVEENLKEFEKMQTGLYDEGEAILRMKIDMKSANSVMRDPIAYRIMYTPHIQTGDKWCIYPSYDYTHCIVDSLEWITHSLCTLEFEIRRDCYYWVLEALDLYRPFVWEFSRLSLEYTMMSKRKLKELVERGLVRGWSDPRMPTLSGMRRRGYSSSAIRAFCAAIGASRAPNMIGMHVLEHFVRSDFDTNCKRVFAVLHPLKVVISNFRGEETLSIPNHPKRPELGTRDMKLTRVLYMEKGDFRMKDEKSYYGLAPGKTAMLRYAYPITVEGVECDDVGVPCVLNVTMDYEKSVKPKGVLHWVNEEAPGLEVRMLSILFKSNDPASLDKSEWLDDFNHDSLEVLSDARCESSVTSAKLREAFQFERVGYFALDDDATSERPVFNQVVSLRDSRPGK